MSMFELRDYQRRTIDMLYSWWDTNSGNPCIVLPTGAGKSVVLAEFIRRAVEEFNSSIMVLTHQKELIEQDYGKTIAMVPDIDCGVFSAGMKRKELGHKVTFAGIQSIYNIMDDVPSVDLILIDECHLINNKTEGRYRRFIDRMTKKNPYTKCIGLTATPYRLSQGLVTDGGLFNEPLIEPVTIKELQEKGYLSKLSSKLMKNKVDVSGIHMVGGDFNRKELEERVSIEGYNEDVAEELTKWCAGRKSWLIFCTGVKHAEKMAEILCSMGINTACITGSTDKKTRENTLEGFKNGSIRALTNVNVLTTGFDHPGVDLIVMLRPTCSPGLYMQMVGRGLRIAPDKENCLILDFAGNIERHGPIHNVTPPFKQKKGQGVPPMKACPECMEAVLLQTMVCPVCGYEWPVKEKKKDEKIFTLGEADINGSDTDNGDRWVSIKTWKWIKARSKAGNPMYIITYYPNNMAVRPFREYLLYGESATAKHTKRLMDCSGMGVPSKVLVNLTGKYASILKLSFGTTTYDNIKKCWI